MSEIYVADGAAQERAKYAEIWSLPEYRTANSPGLENVDRMISVLNPKPGSSIIDVGCGTGCAAMEFERRGFRAGGLDITDAALELDRSRFIEAPLWSDWANPKSGLISRKLRWDYAFCCDVLEHIPPEYTMLCIDRILGACDTAWLQISLRPDEFGKLIGQPLHLTVHDFDWWLLRVSTLGRVVDARDLCGVGLYVVRK